MYKGPSKAPSYSVSLQYPRRQDYMKEDLCKTAFAIFDVDGDGVISVKDLELLFRGRFPSLH